MADCMAIRLRRFQSGAERQAIPNGICRERFRAGFQLPPGGFRRLPLAKAFRTCCIRDANTTWVGSSGG